MDAQTLLRLVLGSIGLVSWRESCASAGPACTDAWGSKCQSLRESCEADAWIREKCSATCGACLLPASSAPPPSPAPLAQPTPAPVLPPGTPPVFSLNVANLRDRSGRILTFELFHHQQSNATAAVQMWCKNHDLEMQGCMDGIMPMLPAPRDPPAPPALVPQGYSCDSGPCSLIEYWKNLDLFKNDSFVPNQNGQIKSHTCWPMRACTPMPECWPPRHLSECADTTVIEVTNKPWFRPTETVELLVSGRRAAASYNHTHPIGVYVREISTLRVRAPMRAHTYGVHTCLLAGSHSFTSPASSHLRLDGPQSHTASRLLSTMAW